MIEKVRNGLDSIEKGGGLTRAQAKKGPANGSLGMEHLNFDRFGSTNPSGFQGFIKIKELKETACCKIDDAPGIYLVLRKSRTLPSFRYPSLAGHFKGKDPTVAVEVLTEKWNPPARILYIGKAGKLGSKSTLKSRIRDYVRFGQGKRVGHRGGRYIWQLEDVDELLICWKVTKCEPRKAEKELIQVFKEKYKARPFANLQD